jgi:uncharacterized protein (UPF0212 family)
MRAYYADLPLAAVEAAAEALDAAECICPKGRNQYGSWYSPSPLCPRCGDSTAKVWVVLRAALPHLTVAGPYTEETE